MKIRHPRYSYSVYNDEKEDVWDKEDRQDFQKIGNMKETEIEN